MPLAQPITIALALWLAIVALREADGGIWAVWLNQLVVSALVALWAAVALLISLRR